MIAVVVAMAMLAAFADDVEIVKVKGRGVGTDKTEALKDAYRDAVERAVGLYVDAEQMMKNEKLVTDQILTQSNAYIEKYEIASENKSANGLVTVNILAEVRKSALTKKLSDVMPTVTVDVSAASRNAHAQAVTEAKMRDDALALMKNELSGFDPIRQLMTVSLASPEPEIEKIKGDAENVRLWYAIDVKIDEAKYYGEFVPRWVRLFDQINESEPKRISLKEEKEVSKTLEGKRDDLQKRLNRYAGGESGTKSFCGVDLPADYRLPFTSGPSPLRCCGAALNEQYVDMLFLRGRVFDREAIVGGLQSLMDIRDRESSQVPSSVWSNGTLCNDGYMQLREGFDKHGGRRFLGDEYKKSLIIIERRLGSNFQGRQFVIPQDCMDEVVGWQGGYLTLDADVSAGYAKHIDYQMVFLDESGNEVASVPFELLTGYLSNSAWIAQEREPKSVAWFVTPFVGARAKAFRKWIPVELPKDDVAKIAKVSIGLAE